MNFRWPAGIALWTLLSGPIFGPPANTAPPAPPAQVKNFDAPLFAGGSGLVSSSSGSNEAPAHD